MVGISRTVQTLHDILLMHVWQGSTRGMLGPDILASDRCHGGKRAIGVNGLTRCLVPKVRTAVEDERVLTRDLTGKLSSGPLYGKKVGY